MDECVGGVAAMVKGGDGTHHWVVVMYQRMGGPEQEGCGAIDLSPFEFPKMLCSSSLGHFPSPIGVSVVPPHRLKPIDCARRQRLPCVMVSLVPLFRATR